ncbi:hypothetical protein V498_01030 [Pseudogymnoascus sp. VKM F-4517 (FW-2822)]|nr:hypothetical protein V498_01030 [Pseudogymnoascus sp. VKM F-4517 (FW-2822)]
MSKRGRTRGSSIQEPEDNDPEDNVLGPRSSSSITVKRPRGRPRKKPLQPEKPRTGRAHRVSDPAIVSTSKPIIAIPSSSRLRALKSAAPTDNTAANSVVHKLGKKRKRTLSGDVCPTVLQTVCEGCRRKSYPHGENWQQGLITICHKCNKEWHAQCMTRKGMQRVGAPGQWECRDCSRKGKPQPPRPAHTHDTEAEVMLGQQARDTASETDPGVLSLGANIILQELDTPCITDYGHLVNFSKMDVFQAQNAYEEARGLLNNVLTERETCRERLYMFRSEIERFRHELEEHRRHFNSDNVPPGDGDSNHSMAQRLVLGISADRDWADKVSAKMYLIRAEERGLTERVKTLRKDAKIKKATLKGVEQQRSRYSTCLETTFGDLGKLQSIITMDFEENTFEGSNSSSESTVDDSTVDSAMSTTDCDTTPPQLRSQRSLIVVLRYTPATELARASNIFGISRVLEQLEKADEREIRGSSLPLETDRVPEQPGPFNAAEAIQEPQGLTQRLEPDKGTSLREAQCQPSNITIHMPFTSDLIEGRNQRQNVSLATSIPQEPDQSCTPEDSRWAQDPHPVIFVSIPAASAPSSGDFNRPKSSEPSSLRLTPEDTSIIAGDRNSEEPHSHRPVLDVMALSAENQYSAGVMINQHPGHQPSRPAETDWASIGAGYENYPRSKPPPPAIGLTTSPSPANPVHNKIVLPPITSFSPTRGALQHSSLLSLTPPTHLLRMSISSNTLGQYTTNDNLQTPVSEAGNGNQFCTGPFWRAQESATQTPATHRPRHRPYPNVSKETTVQERQEQLPLTQTQSPPVQTTAHTAAPPHVNFASTVTEAHISTIDPNFVAQQMFGQKPALSTIPDVPVTPEGQFTVWPGCACDNHRHLYENWPLQDAELYVCAGPFWRPCNSFQERITILLVNGIDDSEIPTPAAVIYRRDLRTLVPHVGHLSDMIINEYLKCLAQYANARRESDIPDSCNKIAMIGSTDPIPPGFLKSLAAFSAIYVPIKRNTHWILAVLYPGSLGQRGRSEVYDSHQHWASNIMTAGSVFLSLKSRLGDEYDSSDWIVNAQQCSRPQRSDSDSGLYVLANAKSITLTLGMVDLDSRAQSLSLRWQFAQELVTQSVVEAF